MEVYLDNSATTRQYDQVTDQMALAMRNTYGNPSSLHSLGVEAEKKERKLTTPSLKAQLLPERERDEK